jgi:hypothetical protein
MCDVCGVMVMVEEEKEEEEEEEGGGKAHVAHASGESTRHILSEVTRRLLQYTQQRQRHLHVP